MDPLTSDGFPASSASNLHHPDLLACLWPPAKNFIKAKNLFLHKPLIYYYADWDSECSKVKRSHTQLQTPMLPSAVSSLSPPKGEKRDRIFLGEIQKGLLLTLSNSWSQPYPFQSKAQSTHDKGKWNTNTLVWKGPLESRQPLSPSLPLLARLAKLCQDQLRILRRAPICFLQSPPNQTEAWGDS